MNIGLVINKNKKDAIKCSQEIISLLKDDADILTHSMFENDFSDVEFYDSDKDIILNSDYVITVGGDGTIINAGKYAAKANKPLIGVNLGRVGFVSGLEKDEISELKRIVTNDFTIDKRMLLDCHVKSLNYGEKTYVILNEVSFNRETFSPVVDLQVDLNNESVINYRSDGIIISTATGSTAYCFSAGGPVVEPQMQCMILNPICPYSLTSRPVIFSGDSVLRVSVSKKNRANCYLFVDGKNAMMIQYDDEITIKKSDFTLDLINLKNKNFYTLLNEKLKEDN